MMSADYWWKFVRDFKNPSVMNRHTQYFYLLHTIIIIELIIFHKDYVDWCVFDSEYS